MALRGVCAVGMACSKDVIAEGTGTIERSSSPRSIAQQHGPQAGPALQEVTTWNTDHAERRFLPFALPKLDLDAFLACWA